MNKFYMLNEKPVNLSKKEKPDEPYELRQLRQLEIEKIPEMLEIIKLIDQITNEIRAKIGLKDLTLPADRILITPEDKWIKFKEGIDEIPFFEDKALPIEADGYADRDNYFMAVAYKDRDFFKLAKISLHEALHLKLELRPNFNDEGYNLTEGLIEELCRHYLAELKKLPQLQNDERTFDSVYKKEREIINGLIGDFYNKNKDKFKDREEVFWLFVQNGVDAQMLSNDKTGRDRIQ